MESRIFGQWHITPSPLKWPGPVLLVLVPLTGVVGPGVEGSNDLLNEFAVDVWDSN
jgi:hypothetical protein